MPVTVATLDALEVHSDRERLKLWLDLIVAIHPQVVLEALHERMTQHTGYISETFRQLVAQGREEGREEGRTLAVESALAVLAARGLAVSADQRARIAGCSDLELLHAWLVRAATVERVERVEELFA